MYYVGSLNTVRGLGRVLKGALVSWYGIHAGIRFAVSAASDSVLVQRLQFQPKCSRRREVRTQQIWIIPLTARWSMVWYGKVYLCTDTRPPL